MRERPTCQTQHKWNWTFIQILPQDPRSTSRTCAEKKWQKEHHHRFWCVCVVCFGFQQPIYLSYVTWKISNHPEIWFNFKDHLFLQKTELKSKERSDHSLSQPLVLYCIPYRPLFLVFSCNNASHS